MMVDHCATTGAKQRQSGAADQDRCRTPKRPIHSEFTGRALRSRRDEDVHGPLPTADSGSAAQLHLAPPAWHVDLLQGETAQQQRRGAGSGQAQWARADDPEAAIWV
jgi:hypothetical protein